MTRPVFRFVVMFECLCECVSVCVFTICLLPASTSGNHQLYDHHHHWRSKGRRKERERENKPHKWFIVVHLSTQKQLINKRSLQFHICIRIVINCCASILLMMITIIWVQVINGCVEYSTY